MQMKTPFFCRNFDSQSTCINNSMALTVTQQEYKLQKFCPYVARCTNECAKEKEKNTTLAIYVSCGISSNHGALLATMGDYLWNDILLL